jgi:glycosyltransferase involved in cell wall biosynthesis
MGGWLEILRLLGSIRPRRMLVKENLSALWEGRGVRGLPKAEVLKVERLPVGPMVAIQTTTRTYIADGLLGHNTMWEYERFRDEQRKTPGIAGRMKDYDLVLAYDDVTEKALGPYAAEAGVPIKVLQGGYHPDYWGKGNWRARDWNGTFRFGMLGRLDRRKQPWAAVRAFGALKDEHGDDFNAELHLKTTLPGLPPQVGERWPGIVVHYEWWPLPKMRAFYDMLNCYVAPSTGEGKNVPALEAQTAGVPVIASEYGGHRNWLSPQWAYPLKVDPFEFEEGWASVPDEEDLKRLMWHVYTHREEARRKGELAARTIPPMCSWHTVMRHFQNLV